MNKLDFDISKLSEYREDNCLEVKKATKGLPNSIWETYSSFANSEGGLIVLGVEEDKNHQLHIAGVNHPDELVFPCGVMQRVLCLLTNNPLHQIEYSS